MMQCVAIMRSQVLSITVVILSCVSLSAADNSAHGKIDIPLGFGVIAGRELHVREPSMCAGEANAQIQYNKSANMVKIRAKFDGLPYRPTICYDYNPSTPFDSYPDCVEYGSWQIWLTGRLFTKQVTYYYDAITQRLLGSEFDNIAFPADAISRVFPVGQAVCTGLFESNPVTQKAHVTFKFDYNQILDAEGTAGMYGAFVPLILDDPSTAFVHYTAPLPISEAMHFDDILTDINNGSVLTIVTSLEPDPKPSFLLAKDNLMIGWGGGFPQEAFATLGFPIDLTPYGDCGTFQLPDPFPFLPE